MTARQHLVRLNSLTYILPPHTIEENPGHTMSARTSPLRSGSRMARFALLIAIATAPAAANTYLYTYTYQFKASDLITQLQKAAQTAPQGSVVFSSTNDGVFALFLEPNTGAY